MYQKGAALEIQTNGSLLSFQRIVLEIQKNYVKHRNFVYIIRAPLYTSDLFIQRLLFQRKSMTMPRVVSSVPIPSQKPATPRPSFRPKR